MQVIKHMLWQCLQDQSSQQVNTTLLHNCIYIMDNTWVFINPFTPKNSLISPLTLYHIVLMMLVHRICIRSAKNPPVDIFLYSHYLSAWLSWVWYMFTFFWLLQVRFMSARASVAFITDQVEEVKQRQFVDLVPGIVQVVGSYFIN